MKKLLLLLCLVLLTGCAAQEPAPTTIPLTQPPATTQAIPTETTPSTTLPPDPVEVALEALSLEQRVGQLFLIRCNKETALEDIARYQPGGLVLFAQDFEDQTQDSMTETLAQYQAAAPTPLLLAVDEEGGSVTRISRYLAFRSAPFPSPRDAYAQGGMDQVLALEEEKCKLLAELGLNMNLAPVCDMADDPNAFLYQRSIGLDAAGTSDFVSRTVEVMAQSGIASALKHFPGYGNNADTHTGMAVDSRSLEELSGRDLQPFAAGIAAGCDAILVSHTIVEAFDSALPASLSPAVHQYLRADMGYDGVILTDDLVMQAITDQYGAGEAAVLAVLAGNDLLCSTDYPTQYQAVLDAVYAGRIDFDTLNAAVTRVLRMKINLGLLPD